MRLPEEALTVDALAERFEVLQYHRGGIAAGHCGFLPHSLTVNGVNGARPCGRSKKGAIIVRFPRHRLRAACLAPHSVQSRHVSDAAVATPGLSYEWHRDQRGLSGPLARFLNGGQEDRQRTEPFVADQSELADMPAVVRDGREPCERKAGPPELLRRE